VLELIGAGFVLVIALILIGLAWAALSAVFWVVLLPFKLLGLVFRGLAALFALPFLLVFGLAGALLFGAGALIFLLPLLPFVLVVLGAALLVRRNRGTRTTPATP